MHASFAVRTMFLDKDSSGHSSPSLDGHPFQVTDIPLVCEVDTGVTLGTCFKTVLEGRDIEMSKLAPETVLTTFCPIDVAVDDGEESTVVRARGCQRSSGSEGNRRNKR